MWEWMRFSTIYSPQVSAHHTVFFSRLAHAQDFSDHWLEYTYLQQYQQKKHFENNEKNEQKKKTCTRNFAKLSEEEQASELTAIYVDLRSFLILLKEFISRASQNLDENIKCLKHQHRTDEMRMMAKSEQSFCYLCVSGKRI